MPTATKPPLAASLILCETVLEEKSGLQSAIRMLTHLALSAGNNLANFNSLTIITGHPGDTDTHSLQVRMVGEGSNGWYEVASAPVRSFSYGFKIDPNGPGGYNLTTNFSVDVTKLDLASTFFVQAWLDGAHVAQAPITLRR